MELTKLVLFVPVKWGEETEIGRGKSNQGNSVYAGGNIFRGITLLEKYDYASSIITSQEIIHVPVVHTELP